MVLAMSLSELCSCLHYSGYLNSKLDAVRIIISTDKYFTHLLIQLFISHSIILYSIRACSVTDDSLQPHGLQPARLLCPGDFPDKNTTVGCQFIPQGIFLIQGWKPPPLWLLHWQVHPLHLATWEAFRCHTLILQVYSELRTVLGTVQQLGSQSRGEEGKSVTTVDCDESKTTQ